MLPSRFKCNIQEKMKRDLRKEALRLKSRTSLNNCLTLIGGIVARDLVLDEFDRKDIEVYNPS